MAAVPVFQNPGSAMPQPAAPSLAQVPAQAQAASLPMALTQLADADAMFERLDFMLGGQVQQAEIELSPDALGPIQVRIRMEREGADIRFAAASPETRQALEQSLPQLRALFRLEGTQLLGVNVSGQAFSDSGQRQHSGAPAAGTDTRQDASADHTSRAARASVHRVRSIQLVDAWV